MKLVKVHNKYFIQSQNISFDATNIEDVRNAENLILKSHNIREILDFAKEVEGVDIGRIEDKLCRDEHFSWVYQFAREVPKANKAKLQKFMIEKASPDYLYYFARDVKGIDVSACEDEIIRMGNMQFVYLFAQYVDGANIKKLEDAIYENAYQRYATKGLFLLYALKDFAQNVKGADVKRIEKLFLICDDLEQSFQFVRDVEGCDVLLFEDKFISSGNLDYIFNFAKEVQGANCQRIEQEILRKRSEQHSMAWLLTFESERLDEHFEIILDSGNFSICVELFEKLKNKLSPIKKEMLEFAIKSYAIKDDEKSKIKNLEKSLDN